MTLQISNESLRVARNNAFSLFDCLANAGELELAEMAYAVLEKLEIEITLRGGPSMLVNANAIFPYFCHKFRKKSTEKPEGNEKARPKKRGKET